MATTDPRRTGIPIASAALTVLWANRPASPSLYDQIFATDIGPNGTTFWWTGTRWKVLFPSVIGENGSIITGVAQTAEQYIGGLGPFPAGLLAAGDVLQYHVGLGKTGTTDAYGAATGLRFGASGTLSDTLLGTQNLSGVMGASIRSGGFEKWFRLESPTTIRALGPNNGGPSWNNFTSGADPALTQTIVNVSTTPWRIGVSTSMAGATNAPQLTYQRLTLLP